MNQHVRTRPGLAHAFAQLLNGARSLEEISDILIAEAQREGFVHIACCSHVDPLDPPKGAVVITNYPQPWIERFSRLRYVEIDPILGVASVQTHPFGWHDRRLRATMTTAQGRILAEASEFGLRDGATIPLHGPGGLIGSFSLAVDHREGIDPASVRRLHWAGLHAYEAARRLMQPGEAPVRPALAARERQCLRLVGASKKDHEIAELLGISRDTVRNTVRNAMRKLGASCRMQAVLRAVACGQIHLEEVLD